MPKELRFIISKAAQKILLRDDVKDASRIRCVTIPCNLMRRVLETPGVQITSEGDVILEWGVRETPEGLRESRDYNSEIHDIGFPYGTASDVLEAIHRAQQKVQEQKVTEAKERLTKAIESKDGYDFNRAKDLEEFLSDEDKNRLSLLAEHLERESRKQAEEREREEQARKDRKRAAISQFLAGGSEEDLKAGLGSDHYLSSEDAQAIREEREERNQAAHHARLVLLAQLITTFGSEIQKKMLADPRGKTPLGLLQEEEVEYDLTNIFLPTFPTTNDPLKPFQMIDPTDVCRECYNDFGDEGFEFGSEEAQDVPLRVFARGEAIREALAAWIAEERRTPFKIEELKQTFRRHHGQCSAQNHKDEGEGWANRYGVLVELQIGGITFRREYRTV